MQGRLPVEVLRRPKEALAGDPYPLLLSRMPLGALDDLPRPPLLNKYVASKKILDASGLKLQPSQISLNTRPRSLGVWLSCANIHKH
jgi:hypothetical protein